MSHLATLRLVAQFVKNKLSSFNELVDLLLFWYSVLGMYYATIVLILAAVPTARQLPPKEKELTMTSTQEAKSQKVEIRIRNISGKDFERVRVRFPDSAADIDYGSLPAGGLSDYHATKRAYRYASLVARIDNRDYSFQPMDYTGETELESGRYTYAVSIGENNTLAVRLEPAK